MEDKNTKMQILCSRYNDKTLDCLLNVIHNEDMIIKVEQNDENKDIEVLITYPEINKNNVERIISMIKMTEEKIECYSENSMKMINIADIFYIESIDRKTVVFCENENYTLKDRLYQVYEKLKQYDFVQISKYCILNINKLENLKTIANSNLKAVLSNGKCQYVTRKYIPDLKSALQEDK